MSLISLYTCPFSHSNAFAFFYSLRCSSTIPFLPLFLHLACSLFPYSSLFFQPLPDHVILQWLSPIFPEYTQRSCSPWSSSSSLGSSRALAPLMPHSFYSLTTSLSLSLPLSLSLFGISYTALYLRFIPVAHLLLWVLKALQARRSASVLAVALTAAQLSLLLWQATRPLALTLAFALNVVAWPQLGPTWQTSFTADSLLANCRLQIVINF